MAGENKTNGTGKAKQETKPLHERAAARKFQIQRLSVQLRSDLAKMNADERKAYDEKVAEVEAVTF